jgi:hypothetical protein
LNVNKIRESKIIGQFDMHKYTTKKIWNPHANMSQKYTVL